MLRVNWVLVPGLIVGSSFLIFRLTPLGGQQFESNLGETIQKTGYQKIFELKKTRIPTEPINLNDQKVSNQSKSKPIQKIAFKNQGSYGVEQESAPKSKEFISLSKIMDAAILSNEQIKERDILIRSSGVMKEAVQTILDSNSSELSKNQALDILILQFDLHPDLALDGVAKVLSKNAENNEVLMGYQAELAFKILDKDSTYLDWIEKTWTSSIKEKILSNIANLENRE